MLFRSFLYENGFKANYIINEPVNIDKSSVGENNLRLFIAAKEVETVDGYAADQNINKFDLVIDWGWFYFFTKPLFFVIDYLFKISGNFGTAIVLLTIAIRLIFFPLANFSFRSMAKMKAVQPEMMRLKELHKDDKVKLQQEMMALYRKEKINPASGCLPILIQIPFFFAIRTTSTTANNRIDMPMTALFIMPDSHIHHHVFQNGTRIEDLPTFHQTSFQNEAYP